MTSTGHILELTPQLALQQVLVQGLPRTLVADTSLMCKAGVTLLLEVRRHGQS